MRWLRRLAIAVVIAPMSRASVAITRQAANSRRRAANAALDSGAITRAQHELELIEAQRLDDRAEAMVHTLARLRDDNRRKS